MPMMRQVSRLAVVAGLGLGVVSAQRGTGDWMTGAFDAQRSNWVRNDAKISHESMQKPGFELAWKMRFDNTARQLNNITPPALIDFYIGYRGFRALGFFGASSDRIIVVDTELGRTEWEKSYTGSSTPASTLPCPGGMTSAVTRPTFTAYPPPPSGRGIGRGTPAKSGVGEPYQGAVTIRPTPRPSQAAPAPRPAPAPKPVGGDVPSPFAPHVQWLLALTGDGKLHSTWISNGEQPSAGVPFLPPSANAHGLIAYDNVAYVATTNGCGGVENGVWALDLTTKKVTQWKSGKSGVAGSVGPAVGPDGTLYAAAGTELTALAPRTLQAKGSYKTGGADFTSSPVVFEYHGKNLIAATTNDGRMHLVDASQLTSGPLHKTPPFSSPGFTAGALASWQDPAGTRWVLAPAAGEVTGFSSNGEVKNGAIVAWKVGMQGGVPSLEPGWASRDLISPIAPIIVNGVVFALSSGEWRPSDPQDSAAQRAQRSTNAVLYALDPLTGKELWNSGTAITSFVHSGGLAAGGSRIYVSTYDGTQYAFGFPIEH